MVFVGETKRALFFTIRKCVTLIAGRCNDFKKRAGLLALTGFVLTPDFALADRPATAEEWKKVENVLRSEGFTQWGGIGFEDNGKWEVDDAVASDGRRYDIKLDQSLKIIERKPD